MYLHHLQYLHRLPCKYAVLNRAFVFTWFQSLYCIITVVLEQFGSTNSSAVVILQNHHTQAVQQFVAIKSQISTTARNCSVSAGRIPFANDVARVAPTLQRIPL